MEKLKYCPALGYSWVPEMLKTIALLKKLEQYPVFDVEAFAALLKKQGAYARLSLHRLEKHGLIYRLERNKYTVHKDPLLVASRITWPSYMSFWSALRWHNLTEQIPQDVWVATPRKRKKSLLLFNSAKIRFVKIDRKYFFGFVKARYGDFEIFVAEPEKAIIDSLLFRKVSWSELRDIMRFRKRALSVRKLMRYATKIGNKRVLQRLKEAIP
ncbi:hypothetical protein HY642_01160 [Candidatus Woesearchaeota archaeon]|nr:hypothetical protein [Candidatus Woesearchaeota archaeon]